MAEVTRRGIVYAGFTHGAGTAKAVKAAKTGYRVNLLGLYLTAASAVNITIEDTAGTNLSEILQFTASNLHISMPFTGQPWAASTDDLGLQILLSGAVVVAGIVIYEQETVDV